MIPNPQFRDFLLQCIWLDLRTIIMNNFSPHAHLRCAQRGDITEQDVELVLLNGVQHRSFQDVEVVLTDRAIAKAGLPDDSRGISVIVAHDGTIITVMRKFKVLKRRPHHLRRAHLIEAIETAEMRRELRGVA